MKPWSRIACFFCVDSPLVRSDVREPPDKASSCWHLHERSKTSEGRASDDPFSFGRGFEESHASYASSALDEQAS